MKTNKHIRWFIPIIVLISILPLLPGTFWKWYWFNYNLMNSIHSYFSS